MGNNSSANESLNDENYDGNDFQVDSKIREGPLWDRKCTDILFFIVFWLFIGGYGWTVHYGYKNGHPEQIFRPVNGDGALCGIGELEPFPKLYYIMRSNDAPRAVCIDTCPREPEASFQCHGTKNVKKEDCDTLFDPATGKGHIGYGTNPLLGRFCVPNINKLPKEIDRTKYDNLVGQFGLDDIQEWTSDIFEARYAFLYSLFTCMIVTLLYAILIYWFTPLVVWVSILTTGVAIVGLGLFMRRYYRRQYGIESDHYEENGEVAQTKIAKSLKYGQYVVFTIGVLYFIAICCLYKAVAVSIAILKTTAVIVIRNLKLLVLPFFSAFFVILWMIFSFYNVGYLLSSGTITQPVLGSQLKRVELEQDQKYMLYVHIFAFFWVLELIQAIFSYIMICGVCQWYFTSSSDTRGAMSLTQGLWWSIRYNFGSLCLGSFILAVVWIIRLTFEYIDKQLKKANKDSAVVNAISNCVRCCLDCFHRFIKFINENAYIQVALTGDNFCTSAVNAFILALKNAATFFITNGVGSLIYFLGKMSICLANTFIGYFMIQYFDAFEEVDNPIPVAGIICIISFVMAQIFMDIFGSVSLACLQCLYADVDICNQNQEDPLSSTQRPKEMASVVRMLSDGK